MIKDNSLFKFNDILDLDAVLPQEVNMSQQLPNAPYMIKNTYHLHSILIHSGTLEAGHYYAFIRPTIDDKWYEFDDSNVS
jgi:ubiquitin carboxyl-terminal hydrolase 7